MTVADFRSPATDDCRHQVATKLDHAAFWDLVVEAIRVLSADSAAPAHDAANPPAGQEED